MSVLPGFLQRVLDFRRARTDFCGAAVAFIYGLPTLGYALGRDQALFFYVGREWAAGRLPYSEAFDIKPPGIYAVYALAGTLFGFQLFAIRLLELFAVLALGACIALVIRRDDQRVRGEIGATMVVTAGFYYTLFDYWDSGQVEFWEALLALGGFVAAERVQGALRAAVVAGLLGGCAVLFKTPVVVVLPVAGCVVVARAYLEAQGTPLVRARNAAIAFVLHCVAGVSVVGLALGYFALRGGWPALVELAGYTATYVKNTQVSGEAARAAIVWFWGDLGKAWSLMLLASFTFGMVQAARRRSYRVLGGGGLAVLLTLTATLSVAAQVKFWTYHWGVLVPFVVLCAAYGVAELGRLQRALLVPVSVVLLLIGFYGTPRWATSEAVNYRSYTRSFWAYVRGNMRRAEFLSQFGGPYYYSYLQCEQVGDAIAALARPGDRLHVRGFEPAIYIVSRLSSPSRFASEAPLLGNQLAYNRESWLAEHEKAIWSNPPRFFVTFAGNWDIEIIKGHGYHSIGELGQFVWLERDSPPPPPVSSPN